MAAITNHAYYPEKKAVGELLALTNPAVIVPDWQRNYSWRSEHVATFCNDIIKFSDRSGDPVASEYFFGSIVLVKASDQKLLLLDGQQRLATSTIFLSAIRDILYEKEPETAEWVQSNYLASFDPIKAEHINKLRLNVYDRDFFKRLISEKRQSGYVEPNPEHASHHLIKAAKDFITNELENHIASMSPSSAVVWLRRIVNILTNHFTVIAAYSDNEDSAAEVFETLNDRGVGLSTPDLLRNLIIRRSPNGLQEQIVKQWESVIAFQTDTEIKSFLRHYWISRHGDVKSQSLYREVKSTIESDEISSSDLSTDLFDAARVYREVKSANVNDDEAADLLEEIKSLGSGAAILLPSLLSVFQGLEVVEQRIAVLALLNFYVRDGVIGRTENSVLENKLYKAARDLRETRNLDDFCATLAEGALSDDDVRLRFGRLSLTQNALRRYLLYKLEMAKRGTGELSVNPPSKVHVEHIYPQTPQAGQRWANHSTFVNRLGNLTLLDKRINTTIRNGVFSLKKTHYANSEIILTKELCTIDAWGAEQIVIRQEEMAGFVCDLWPLIFAT